MKREEQEQGIEEMGWKRIWDVVDCGFLNVRTRPQSESPRCPRVALATVIHVESDASGSSGRRYVEAPLRGREQN